MAWSSFAHLPTTEEEYVYILSKTRDGFTAQEMDHVIASYKNKENVQHHYRSNLVRLGLFIIHDNIVSLNYNQKKLLNNKKYIKEILKKVIEINHSYELKVVRELIVLTKSYNLSQIVNILHENIQMVDVTNLKRWIRPIISLFMIVDILSENNMITDKYINYLQDSYLFVAKEFKKSVPLELVEQQIQKLDKSINIDRLIETVLDISSIRYKVELLMMPNWATANKIYTISQDLYTHIRIKKDLKKGDNR